MEIEMIHWWQKFGNIAQIAAPVMTAVGIVFVLMQIHTLESVNRTAGARQIYLGYVEKEFQYPQFANPDYDRIKQSSADEQTRYESFVSYMLYSCEEALVAFKDREWRLTCEEEVKPHLPYLCEKLAKDTGYLNTFAQHTGELVRSVMAQSGIKSPECKVART
jgi:hypothetical protein